MIYLVLLLVCLIACLIGAISGLGGGVIIKPVLDSFIEMSPEEISFLCGSTVLTMSTVSLIKLKNNFNELDYKTAIYLGIGSSIGGIFGKHTFYIIKNMFENDNKISLIQAILLFFINLFIYIYIKHKNKIKSYIITNFYMCIISGIFLGFISSFLGIGGGPLNIALLYILFSMKPKQATLSSLIIVFFSQSSSFATSIIKGLPQFDYKALLVMCLGAIIGALVGSNFAKRMNNYKIEKFFIKVLIFLLVINIYNILKFSKIL